MKVAFITRHTPSNYGSVLQTFATQKAIEALGHEAVCINYIRTDELPENQAKTHLAISRWNKNAATRLLYKVTQKPVFDAATKRFDVYRSNMLKLTDEVWNTPEQLAENPPKADIYMTGSDQVWNTVGTGVIDPAYFLSFVPDDKKKIAYAGCFGTKTVRDEDRDNIIKWLKRYDHITIREKSGVELAKSLGVDAEQVLDPTFLMTPQNWLDTLPKKEKKESYVLVYQLHPNKEFQTYAKEFAKRKNMKLIRVNPYFHHMFKPGKFVFCPPVEEFLWYIKNADYFLTDSSHGTLFAIGLNTQFVDVLPNVYSERNRSILATAGLEDRILMSYDDFKIADTPIDFTAVNQKINAERTRSAEILKKIIEE